MKTVVKSNSVVYLLSFVVYMAEGKLIVNLPSYISAWEAVSAVRKIAGAVGHVCLNLNWALFSNFTVKRMLLTVALPGCCHLVLPNGIKLFRPRP